MMKNTRDANDCLQILFELSGQQQHLMSFDVSVIKYAQDLNLYFLMQTPALPCRLPPLFNESPFKVKVQSKPF